MATTQTYIVRYKVARVLFLVLPDPELYIDVYHWTVATGHWLLHPDNATIAIRRGGHIYSKHLCRKIPEVKFRVGYMLQHHPMNPMSRFAL